MAAAFVSETTISIPYIAVNVNMCPWRSWIARRTPTYAARRVSEIRKRLKALAPRAAKTKKRHAVDYCLTTKKQKADPRRLAQVEHTCPWRSWIARRTPTPKVAGSNPVGHTTPHGSVEPWGILIFPAHYAACRWRLFCFCRMRGYRCPASSRPARDRGDLRPSQHLCRLRSAGSRSYDEANAHSGYTADRFS